MLLRMLQRQQCRTKFRPSKKVETNWTCSVSVVSTLSKGRNFVRCCCQKRQQCRRNIRLCCVKRIVPLVAFDNVASTLLVVWTGLDNRREKMCRVCSLQSLARSIALARKIWSDFVVLCVDCDPPSTTDKRLQSSTSCIFIYNKWRVASR